MSRVKAALTAATLGFPMLAGALVDSFSGGLMDGDPAASLFGLGVALCWAGSVHFFYERDVRAESAAFPLCGRLTLRAMAAWAGCVVIYFLVSSLWYGAALMGALATAGFTLFFLSILCAVSIVPLSMLLALVAVLVDPSRIERIALKPNQ